jgi:hypothetical protein
MKLVKVCILAWAILAGGHLALAKPPALAATGPLPVGSPGAWVGSDDYPAAALRLDVEGITSFRLSVDVTGKPSRCEIVESSSFDILDRVTCDRLMANAHFTPGHDRAGRPMEGTYANRVRWQIPEGENSVSESYVSALLSIDQSGKITGCQSVSHISPVAPASLQTSCEQMHGQVTEDVALDLRDGFKGAIAEVDVEMANVFTPALRDRVEAPIAGYEQHALNVHRFTVTNDGKLTTCNYEQQRGSSHMIEDFCGNAQRNHFDPPFGAFDTKGVATGWHIMRVLLKTGH